MTDGVQAVVDVATELDRQRALRQRVADAWRALRFLVDLVAMRVRERRRR